MGIFDKWDPDFLWWYEDKGEQMELLEEEEQQIGCLFQDYDDFFKKNIFLFIMLNCLLLSVPFMFFLTFHWL